MAWIDEVLLRDASATVWEWTVADAFRTIVEQIHATPVDAQPLFQSVKTRLDGAHARLRVAPPDPHGATCVKFKEAIEKLTRLLTPYTTQVLAGRVVQHRRLSTRLREIHEALDGVYRDLHIRESGESWSTQLTRDFDAHAKSLEMIIHSKETEQSLLHDRAIHFETLTLLNHARKKARGPEQWNRLAQKLYEIVIRLPVRGDVRSDTTSTVPSWFVPSTDVRYDPKPFESGSFGAVHRGMWNAATKVVVKILRDGKRLETQVLEDFLKEADLWSKFTHPNCLRMYGGCHVSKPPFILCEDATNGNLNDYLKRGEGPESNRETKMWRRFFEASLGIEYLHKKNVIHGDLKNTNIVVGADGYARIADFGLSRVKKAEAQLIQQEKGVSTHGALRWTAPECFDGDFLPESDIYAFGVCIYEVFAKGPPYKDLDDASARLQIQNGKPLPRPDEISDEMWKLVLHMTRKDPTERASIKQVIAQLKKEADREYEQEHKKYVLCVECQTRLSAGSNFCNKCGRTVQTKPVVDETIRVGSSEDLARIVNILTIGEHPQKIECMTALIDYVFGDPIHQEKARKAGAIPVLVHLLEDALSKREKRTSTEPEPIVVKALLALGSIYALNEPIQTTAAEDGIIDVLVKVLASGAEKERVKAIMAIGLLIDNHDDNKAKIPLEMVDTMRRFEREGSKMLRSAAEKVLQLWNATPTDGTATTDTRRAA